MRAGEVMTRNVVTVHPDAPVRKAACMMDDLDVGALPVCDGRRLVGIITDRDITVRATADGMRPDVTPVHAVMTEDVCWCFEDDSVEAIEREMGRRQIRRLPVVDGRKRLVGMISLGDLASDLAEGTERTLRSISWPAEPDRASRRRRASNRDASWPDYGPAADLPRG
ncbi:MAG: CBS domain-containing protein [Reyranella sp.]|uniref:CBS domain-containing protein n=1 Tax=Reyranella sp. TaxID=1929291 RepID=UPI003D14C7F0